MLSVAHTWSLAALAAVTGLALLWTWKLFSNPERIALARRQMRARLYALRLYGGDPALVLGAQGQLLLWIARYLLQMLPPIAVAILPLLFLFVQLDNSYGHRPLVPGESAIVTARFDGRGARTATLQGSGVAVETPGVRMPDGRQVCWRVRMEAAGRGSLLLRAPGIEIAKTIACGHGLRMPPTPWQRSPRLDVSCPAVNLDVCGFGVSWVVWFLFVSLVTMLVLRGRCGVHF